MNKRAFRTSTELNASPERVWRALTDPRELSRWFPLSSTVVPREGGLITWQWRDKYIWKTHVDVFEEGHRLRLLYDYANDFATGTEALKNSGQQFDADQQLAIEFTIESRDGKTVLTLVHSGFGTEGSWDGEYEGTSRGWISELRSLKHYLDFHFGEDRCVAWIERELTCAPQEAWNLIFGTNGLRGLPQRSSQSAGDRFILKSDLGDEFDCVVDFIEEPKDFIGVIHNLNNASFRVWISEHARQINLWLATYGLDPSVTKSFEHKWTNHLQQLLAR